MAPPGTLKKLGNYLFCLLPQRNVSASLPPDHYDAKKLCQDALSVKAVHPNVKYRDGTILKIAKLRQQQAFF